MAHRSFMAVAFVGLGLLSCGAGEVADSGAPVLDQSPAGNPNQAATNPNQPARNPNQPVSNQQPAGASSVPGVSDVVAICTEYCDVLLDCTGLRGQPDAQLLSLLCLAGCAGELGGAPECADLVLDHQACVGGIGQVCTLAESQDGVNTPGCEAQDQAIRACTGGEVDDCTLQTNCVCGGDICEQCLCAAPDPASCDPICVATN